ncbi:MAG: WD40 repeat domain-containing protein [Cytophagia bacterium]|nr:MAG: WD40 repeat domain-containing protein [Cytophagales bacterium]TAG37336.1 MAG: WD40 repeat domain-containing protein [Cytophagia bacterium]TAG58819.1 MAG: WD40 repeat domain-containing protein [Runella slithyformis]TAG60674.1 MAG: WD40 repeat domain-containing protein [Runella slithyformis]TAG78318.1 MAG: WD40 repeat domain-containing protein [Cytophagales bacterium]
MIHPKVTVQKIDTFSGHRDCVYTLQNADAPSHFFSAGADGMVVQWDLSRPDFGNLIARVPASVYAIAFDAAQNELWVGQNLEGIQVINPTTKQLVKSSKITNASIFDIQFLENQAFVALSDGVVVVMDMAHFAVKKHLKASTQNARCVAICAASRQIAVGYSDHFIRIFDADTLQLQQVLSGHTNSVFTLQYAPDGRYLVSGGRDAHLKVWDVAHGYALCHDIPAHLFAINHLTYSPDGQYVATGSMDKAIKIWNADTFKLIKVIDRARHAGHGTSVNKLLWSNFQNRLLSGSDDRLISVWEIGV